MDYVTKKIVGVLLGVAFIGIIGPFLGVTVAGMGGNVFGGVIIGFLALGVAFVIIQFRR